MLNGGKVLERAIRIGEDEELPLFAFGAFEFQAYYYSGLYSNQGPGRDECLANDERASCASKKRCGVCTSGALPVLSVISVFSDRDIQVPNVDTNTERAISEERQITSLSVLDDNKYLIVNLNSQKIHMWDVEGSWENLLRLLQPLTRLAAADVVCYCFTLLQPLTWLAAADVVCYCFT
nr:hypothetical protein [Tanacetum cinerariifolium]